MKPPPCPHCAEKDAEIAQLRRDLAAAVRADEARLVGEYFGLPRAPASLLVALYQAKGRVCSREALNQAVPGKADERELKTLDVYVNRIRRRSDEITDQETIENVFAEGWRITPHGAQLVERALAAADGSPFNYAGLTPAKQRIYRARQAKPKPPAKPLTLAAIGARVRAARDT